MDKLIIEQIMKKQGLSIEEVLCRIDRKDLTKKEIDNLLVEISWTQYPDVIKKLLAYGTDQSADEVEKSEKDIKEEWKVEKLKNGTLRLLQYKGTDSVVIIPEKIGNNKVSEIGEYALSPVQTRIKKELKDVRQGIKKIVMGDFIKTLGQGVFKGCENLETVVLSKGLKNIPDEAFMDCNKLVDIEIPGSVTRMGGDVFRRCESLEEIRLPDSIKTIKWISKAAFGPDWTSTFSGCISLKRITLPTKLLKINTSEFCGCKALEIVSFPDELRTIGEHAFEGCISLSNINFPDGLEKIQWAAFEGCKKLKQVAIPISVQKIDKEAFKGIKGLTLILKENSPIIEFAEKNNIAYAFE